MKGAGVQIFITEKGFNNPLSIDMGRFADTEQRIQIGDASRVKNQDIILFCRFKDFQTCSVDDQLMQIFFVAHQLHVHGAKSIIAVLPYLPYARQCKDVKSEHTGLFAALGDLCAAVGISHVISCEVHEETCKILFGVPLVRVPLDEITLEHVWYDMLQRELDPSARANLCFVSPDRGGIERAKRLATLFDAPTAFVEKRRVAYDQSEAFNFEGNVKDKTVVLIDDIIDTGVTAVQACNKVLEHGAKRVLACFTHPVLSPGARELVQKSKIEHVWVTNTIATCDEHYDGKKITTISVDDHIAQYLHTVFKKG